MSTPDLARPDVDWERHRGTGAPKILPPPGVAWTNPATGREVGHRYYTRVTTFADAISDSYNLAKWKQRRVLVGVGQRPDYQALAASLTIADTDRDALDDLAERCIEASGPNAADLGTALHGFTEKIDRGEPLGHVPEQYRPHLDAYARATSVLAITHREVRTVCDELEIAGTPDTLATCEIPDPDGVVDDLRVVDLKSGSGALRFPGKVAGQMAAYARSALYDPRTGARQPMPLNTRWGLIVYLSAAELDPAKVVAELYWVDLTYGWEWLQACRVVKALRKAKPEELLRPATPPPAADPGEVARVELAATADPVAEDEGEPVTDELADQIRAAVHSGDLRVLWARNMGAWTAEHDRAAAARFAELTAIERNRAPQAALLAAIETAASHTALAQLWAEHHDLFTPEHHAAAARRSQDLHALSQSVTV